MRVSRAVVRVQRVVSTVALVVGVVALVVVPRLAIGLVPALFMTGCLLVMGLLARTRTLGLRPLLLLMGISVPWSLLIAFTTQAIGEAIGLSTWPLPACSPSCWARTGWSTRSTPGRRAASCCPGAVGRACQCVCVSGLGHRWGLTRSG
ncbi:MAG: hypothetical protein E7Z94_06580 [Actinomyces ruminicola]|nr:hypothetical protein [Actinomyces ruminicola]